MSAIYRTVRINRDNFVMLLIGLFCIGMSLFCITSTIISKDILSTLVLVLMTCPVISIGLLALTMETPNWWYRPPIRIENRVILDKVMCVLGTIGAIVYSGLIIVVIFSFISMLLKLVMKLVSLTGF